MTRTLTIAALTLFAATAAQAETMIDTLCGAGHVNEVAAGDVVANPDGYYVRSLRVQLSHGDARIVQAVGKEFHLCTRTAATPDMDAHKARLLMNERGVRYLFVPVCPPKAQTNS